MSGQLQLMVVEGGESKLSKTVDENSFFGLKEVPFPDRNDFAIASSLCRVIVF
jgi:hypothetical protein